MRKINLALVLLSIAAAMSISACEGKKTKENEPKAVETPIIAEEPKTLQEAVEQLEKEGKYPVLDRTETLLGEDKDGNGVRDDIDAYIDSLPDTPEQKAALRQDAEANNYALAIDITNPNQIAEYHYKSGKASNCLYEKYGDDERRNALWKTLFAFTFNTRARIDAYFKLNNAVSGTSWKLPKEGCDEKFNK